MKRAFITMIILYACSLQLLAQGRKDITTVDDYQVIDHVNNRYAFIIGIDDYADKRMNLGSCIRDASNFYGWLLGYEGWTTLDPRITLLISNQDKELIKKKFENFINAISDPENATVYFYYSGHGAIGAMVPRDGIPQKPETFLGYDWIKGKIRERGIGATVYVLDACHSGSFIDEKAAPEDNAEYSRRYTTAVANNSGGAIVFAAVNSFQTTPSGVRLSQYTTHLMDALRGQNGSNTNSDNIITAGEVQDYLIKKLGDSYTPQFMGSRDFAMALAGANTLRTMQQDLPPPMRQTSEIIDGEDFTDIAVLKISDQNFIDNSVIKVVPKTVGNNGYFIGFTLTIPEKYKTYITEVSYHFKAGPYVKNHQTASWKRSEMSPDYKWEIYFSAISKEPYSTKEKGGLDPYVEIEIGLSDGRTVGPFKRKISNVN